MDKLIEILKSSINEKVLVKATFSSPLSKSGEYLEKFSVKPVLIKNEITFQIEYFQNKKAFHKNLKSSDAIEYITHYFGNFKNINIFTTTNEYIVINNKGKVNIKSKNSEKTLVVKEQNKKKEYIIPEGEKIEFLYDLGIMDIEGNVLKTSYSKFRQINRYLEFIRDVIDELSEKKVLGDIIKVVDFGSGKSYLTFVLYYYLKVIRNMNVEIIGLDLKKDVMEECASLAKKYGFHDLEFLTGDIKDFHKLQNVDMIFSLHACNNATDYALLKGLELGAKAILAVPCCQNEFTSKINNNKESQLREKLAVVTNYGIIQENVASLLTDAFRAEIMGMCGYRSSVIEFISTEHTPKNLLVKCIKEDMSRERLDKSRKNVESTMNFLGIEPMLYSLLEKYFL